MAVDYVLGGCNWWRVAEALLRGWFIVRGSCRENSVSERGVQKPLLKSCQPLCFDETGCLGNLVSDGFTGF